MALTQISTAGVKDDAVTSGKIPANAVGSSELADNAVDTTAIADDAVTADKLANSINTSISAKLPLAGGTLTGNLVLSSHHPKLSFTDTDHNSDFQIMNNHGNLLIYDETNATSPFNIDSNGNIQVSGTVDGVDVAALSSTVSGLNSTTINNNADNRVITGSGTANTLNGEANLTFNSSLLNSDGNGSSNLGSNFLLLKRTSGTTNYLNAPLADGELYISADEAIRFATVHTADFNSTERMRINASGHVGIGTTSPNLGSHTKTLTISDTSSAARTAIEIEGNTGNAHGVLEFRNNGTLVSGVHSRGSNRLQFVTGSGGTVKAEVTGDDFKIEDGNLIIGTAGHGIDFSATVDGSSVSNVSANSELLDDYEEGTFQPILKRLMTNGTTETNFYTQGTRQGNYQRIGNRVYISARIHWSGGSTGSGSLILTNLPYTVDNTNSGANEVPLVVGYRDGINYTKVTGYSVPCMNRFMVTYFDSASTHLISPGATDNSGALYFTAHYEIA